MRPSVSLEEFSFELQKIIARLQDEGVHGIGPCSLYMELRDASGELMALYDDEGRGIEILDT